MTYEQVASITQVAALLLFVVLFVGVLIYAFWPGNKKRFERRRAASIGARPSRRRERRLGHGQQTEREGGRGRDHRATSGTASES